MTNARRARSTRNPQALREASDTDTDHEATPKAQRRGVKKRLSEVYHPEHDTSFSLESGRVPLQPVNINDDAAERRRRRKSAKFENAQAGPSSEGMSQELDPAASPRAARQKPLVSVAPPQAINVPLDVMSSNFEEWMKMATDNKINAANSWNFALIDYFHDMSLLRNNSDNSINFQRASCTLDGCVKIWTSRVDSVGTETGKLLSNLATEGNNEDVEDLDNPDAQDPTQQRRRAKVHRPESTLAKNAAQLRSKKLDLEFSVDPLFRKTCADFDEGGAQGLLMNHLSLAMGADGGMKVVFDASDSIGKVAEEDEVDVPEPQEDVDLSHLRKEFLPDLAVLDGKAISHSLANFSFSKDAYVFDETTFLREESQQPDDDDHDDGSTGGGDPTGPQDFGGPVEDFFVGDQAVGDEFGGADVDEGFDGGEGEDNDSVGTPGNPPATGGDVAPFDPRRIPNERDLIMAMTDADGDAGILDYFDQNFLKNWAGPEHWKLRKVVRKPEVDPNALKPRRGKKEAFKIDFSSVESKELKEIETELFAPITRGAGINLPSATGAKSGKTTRGKKNKAKAEKRDDHLLPDDMHFSSRQLVTLFLKPKFSWKLRGQRIRHGAGGNGEVDENFWAQAAADQAVGRAAQEEGDETINGGAIPFNTQFFHDDYDDGAGFDDMDDGEAGALGTPEADGGEQDLLAATQGLTRRVRPEFVNYAKRAKRVDVRKLKENIWKSLNIVVEQPERQMALSEPPPPLTDPSEAREFTSVMSGLEKSYPKDKLEDISTSFCFICLLHLANEQGLRLESAKDQTMGGEDEQVDKKQIGSLWDLQVYRDPNATRAA